MHRIHTELMKQTHLKAISGLINILQSLQNVGSVRYHFQLPGGMCCSSFNLWLPSKRRKTKRAERKENTTRISPNQWETRKQSMQNTTLPFSYPLTQKLKDRDLVIWKLNMNSVWVAATAVCAYKHECMRAAIKADYLLPISQSKSDTVILSKSHRSVREEAFLSGRIWN